MTNESKFQDDQQPRVQDDDIFVFETAKVKCSILQSSEFHGDTHMFLNFKLAERNASLNDSNSMWR